MPTWNTNSGEWNNALNWIGGLPNGVGAVTDFTFTNASGNVIVGIQESETVTIGVLDARLAIGDFFIQGSAADSGAGTAVLRFDNGGGAALIRAFNATGTGEFGFLATNGLRIELVSSAILNVAEIGGRMRITAPISGAGDIIKAGPGRLRLDGTNTMTGTIYVSEGELWARNDAALGSGLVTIADSAVFRSSGTIDNAISTATYVVGVTGSGRIVSEAGLPLTLTGALNYLSPGRLAFGDGSADSEVIASFSSVNLGSTAPQKVLIDGGILRLGNAGTASLLLGGLADKTTDIVNGAFLDTRGFSTIISNLTFLNGSRILASSGTLNIQIYNSNFVGVPHNGTIQGTAGLDSVAISTDTNFSLSGITFNSWTASDIIQIIGGSTSNILEGSAHSDIIYGAGGDDTILGSGGFDFLYGEDGNDTISLIGSNDNSSAAGGTGIDTLGITGDVDLTTGSLSGFELVRFDAPGSNLRLTSAQFNSGLTANAAVINVGTITIDMVLGSETVLTRGLSISPGFNVIFVINGTTGNDLYKGHLNARHDVNAGDGSDRVNGGNGHDILRGGNGIDKLRGDGGGDDLYGGAGADVFKYRAVADSGFGAASDYIFDYEVGIDRLNFGRIDTNPGLAGDQGFTFIGASAFSGIGSAEIRYHDNGLDLLVLADIDGDSVADMQVVLYNRTGQVLTLADFVL